MDIISIEEVKRIHKGTWFSKANMRFFKTRLPQTATVKDNKAYFITSEQFETDDRKYTIRGCDMETGIVKTVGEFNEMTKYEAHKKLKELVGG